jgi:hypothetical protein
MSSLYADKVLSELWRYGLLLASDRRLLSVTTLVSGKPVHGSWWASPRGREIYRVMSNLAEHPDVTVAKLINHKITYVHRKLWNALVAVATEQAPWQFRPLSSQAKELFSLVTRRGSYATNEAPDPKQCGRAAAELEFVLLVCAEELHTERGAHAKQLRTWQVWCSHKKFVPGPMTPDDAKTLIERTAHALPSMEPWKLSVPWR